MRRHRVAPKLGSFGEIGPRVTPRSVLVAIGALACWFMLVVRDGAEQVDSGWAVASPSPLATGPATPNLEQQLVLRQVLEQTQQPLLRARAPKPAPQPAAGRGQPDLRFAARPESPDGWRAVGEVNAPLNENWTPQIVAPQQAASGSSSKAAEEAECDCSGTREIAAPTPAESQARLARLPAVEETKSPAVEEVKSPEPASPTIQPQNSSEEAVTDRAPADAANEAAPSDANSITPLPADAGQSNVNTPDTSSEIESNKQPQAAAASPPPAKLPSKDVLPVNDRPPLTRQLLALRTRVRAVLKGYYRKALSSSDNDPWEAMHGMLAYGVHSRIHNGGPNGELITSVGWLCYNKPCKGQTLLYVNPAGELRAKYGVGLQGHLGQFLAMLAQCHVSPDYPIHVGDHQFTIRDLIEAEKKTCYPKSELTFKLIALQHYADLNDKWENDQGLEWDFPRLVREELAQPIRGAACGGTHRLSGLSLTVKTRLRRGEPLDGEYQKAADFVKRYQMYAFRLQNNDGSLSTSWFRGSGDDEDINRRIKTTGHILEWLCYSLSDDELREPHTIRAVTYLANLMYSNYDNEWEIGPRSHATHALLLYDQRVFQPFDKDGDVAVYQPKQSVAKRIQSGGSTIRR